MTENKNFIRRNNLETLTKFLFKRKEALKAEMAKETGISVVTINALVKQLVAQNVLIEKEKVQQPLGRPAIRYAFNYEQSHYLLLSIQEAKEPLIKKKLILLGRIIDLAGGEKYTAQFDFEPLTMDTLIEYIDHFLNKGYAISKIGLSLPGKIYQGTVTSSWNEQFDGWQIEASLKNLTDIPMIVQNDSHILTMGFCAEKNILQDQTVVGIFYPEKSMPGITIYSNGTLLEGSHGLAGEAKFLPNLIHAAAPQTGQDLAHNLAEILSIYNAVIAPDIFVISSESVDTKQLKQVIFASSLIAQQANQPNLLFIEDFQKALYLGLHWLVSFDSIYALS